MSVSKELRALWLISAFSGLLVLYGCSHFEKGSADFIISVHELHENMKSDIPPLIVDIRTQRELKSGMIPTSKWVDFNDPDFVSKIAAFNKKEVYLYCQSGRRSEAAAKELMSKGYSTIYSLSGGIRAWKRNNYKTEKLNK